MLSTKQSTAPMSSACMRTRSNGASGPAAMTGPTAPTPTKARRLSAVTHARCPTVLSPAPLFETESARKAKRVSSLTAFSSTGFTRLGTGHVHAMRGGFVNVRSVSLPTPLINSARSPNTSAMLPFRERMNGGDRFMMGSGSGFGRGEHASSALIAESSGSPSTVRTGDQYCFEDVSEILKSLRRLEIDEEEEKSRGVGIEVSDLDLPNIEWISELVQ
ncbi:hypothetical protein Patl1_19809 [Pistacia atlantica]|uniref:Uncharacterized protein n=1 Tax=Pistacia atlantica TaxID=434234 RepID=A0ACC1BNL8_9ROSI|nr:hypothetical protein Patl1_19809 [Pistacia atlantica]